MHKIIENISISLTAADVLKGQGIDPSRASGRLHETAETVISEAYALLKPTAIYTMIRVTNFEHQAVTIDGGCFEGSLVARSMAGADLLYLAICTIGADLENRVDQLMNIDPVTAVALDGAGIASLRKVSNAVEEIISSEVCELDLCLGMRIQPGQEGWSIEQQREVFKILPAERIGVRLTESCLMLPRKSVSFAVPIGKALSDGMTPCDYCSKKNRCEWRKEKQPG